MYCDAISVLKPC